MLYESTVEEETLGLLRELQSEKLLQNFYLVGGTALALYLGHRKSVDLDLFSEQPFDVEKIEKYLYDKYGFLGSYARNQTLKGVINGVKIDLINYPYANIDTPLIDRHYRISGIKDIIAMKLSVIADSGTRIKDFVDIAYLSTLYSFDEMLGFYEQKFPSSNRFRPLKALAYFDDIDFSENIVMLNDTYDWNAIETRLMEMTKDTEKRFEKPPLESLDYSKSKGKISQNVTTKQRRGRKL